MTRQAAVINGHGALPRDLAATQRRTGGLVTRRAAQRAERAALDNPAGAATHLVASATHHQQPDPSQKLDTGHPPAAPRPSLALCDVVDCNEWVEYGRLGLCGRCYQRWSRERPSLEGFKRAGVPARSPIFDGRHACLADLPPLVEAQLLLGIQRVIKLGLRVGADSFERVARRVRDGWVEDVAVLSDASVLAPRDSEMFTTLRVILEAATDAMTDVESEFQRDVWHLRVLYPATRLQTRVISFVEISQRWLRELTKVWCQRRSASIAESTLYQSACCTRGLSRFLATLPHRGERPELLTREDLPSLSI